MAITYTWKISSLKTRKEGEYNDVVVQTYWTKTGTDENGNTGTFSGATPFTTTNMPEGAQFIPFSELTEEIVLNWIKSVVIGGYEEHVNFQIAKQIAEKSNPTIEATPPWASIATPAENLSITSNTNVASSNT